MVSSNNITYSHVFENLLNKLKEQNKSIQQLNNHKSIFKKWLVFFNKKLESPADEFENFKNSVEIFFLKNPYANSSMPSRKYWLSNFYKSYLILKSKFYLPYEFNERLSYLIKLSGSSRAKIAKEAKVLETTLTHWCIGKYRPKRRHLEKVHRLEEVLKVSTGTLADILLLWPNKNRPALTAYSQLQRSRARFPFGLKYADWPNKVRTQWELLKEHHTTKKTPILPRHPWAVWDKPTTILARRRFFVYFFGFLTLSKKKGGLGVKKSELDLRMISELTDQGTLKYFEPFMEFSKKRTMCSTFPDGVYTRSLKRDLDVLCTYLNAKNGFFVHSSNFSTGSDWKNNCAKSMVRIINIIKGTEFVQVRFPEDPIDFIIRDKHPLRFLRDLINAIKNKLPASIKSTSDKKLLNMYFVCSFLSGIPLRASMLCNMKLNRNLYKDSNGCWRVKFDPINFKNFKGAAKERKYDVFCPEWLNPIIDMYLKFRPIFPGGGMVNGKMACDYVIRPAQTSSRTKKIETDPVRKETIFEWCIKATSTFISNCWGFGPQAWRHIIATDWIKNNPNGFQIAAYILHDRLETVRSNYEHLETDDWISHYNIYSDLNFSEAKNEMEIK